MGRPRDSRAWQPGANGGVVVNGLTRDRSAHPHGGRAKETGS